MTHAFSLAAWGCFVALGVHEGYRAMGVALKRTAAGDPEEESEYWQKNGFMGMTEHLLSP